MIPFNNFAREYANIRDEIDAAIRRVLERGWFVLGEEVTRFEEEFARYNGAEYGVAVNSGTDALYLSLHAAGIGEGDEVIVPVNTALPTAMAVAMSGARPVFVDCNDQYLIDDGAIAAAITPATKAVIPVHLYGQACDLKSLSVLARARNLLLIEDCAQATGARSGDNKVGSVGDFGAFSFYPTKNLGAYGDGGMILTNNREYYEKLRALRVYGRAEQHATMPGINSRLDEVQASILRAKLPHLEAWNTRRREIARRYEKLLGNADLILPRLTNGDDHVYHLFVIRVKERDALRSRLQKKGVETLVHYHLLMHQHPVFADQTQQRFPNAERFAAEILSLPIYPYLTDEEIDLVANAVRS